MASAFGATRLSRISARYRRASAAAVRINARSSCCSLTAIYRDRCATDNREILDNPEIRNTKDTKDTRKEFSLNRAIVPFPRIQDEYAQAVPDYRFYGGRRFHGSVSPRSERHVQRAAAGTNDPGRAAHVRHRTGVGSAGVGGDIRRSGKARTGDDEGGRSRDGGVDMA